MSQKLSRKGPMGEEKEKQADTPVKDMKKKVAANAEKEKQVEKTAEKQPDKTEKQKQPEKPAEKDKQKQPEKVAEKEKAQEKSADKTEKKVEKNGVEKKADSKDKDKKDDKEKKDDKAEKNGKAETKKTPSKQNGSKQNGESNGVEEAASDDDVLEIADDEFPELAYDDNSDTESPTDGGAHSRSATRRSQVKATRTPETPQPGADKPPESADSAKADQQKDSKVLKMNEAPPTDRKLRSDDPKAEKKQDTSKDASKDEEKKESKKDEEKKESKKDEAKKDKKENGDNDLDAIEIIEDEEPRKTDTNYSKSRVKVSPYRRSTRLADQTASSVLANYTGNNTTMEMDITESSIAEEPSLDDSSYLSGLRSIRGRKSYKPLKEITLKHANRSVRSTASTSISEWSSRPTGTVVGRKRKPEGAGLVELASEVTEGGSGRGAGGEGEGEGETEGGVLHTKRMRLLDRIAQPFRRTIASTPILPRRNPEIVGINTDLPLTAPVASPTDLETLKPTHTHTNAHTHIPTLTHTSDELDKKRCVIM